MKQQNYVPNLVPTANLAVNKNRIKLYESSGSMPTYYLQKGQEFQFELFNPTKSTLLAKIILNGQAISQGGLILRPGERVYLERFIDVPKKFVFDTYLVSNTEEVKKAIEDNGDVKVEFYREYVKPYIPPFKSPFQQDTYFPINATPYIYYDGQLTRNFSSDNLGGLGLASSDFSYFSSSELSLENPMNQHANKLRKKTLLDNPNKSTKSIETGRIEKGSESNQKFEIVNKEFDLIPFHTIEYKLLPVSEKINTSDDINVKRYCTNCGKKVNKTDKFCSNCGKKV